MSEYEKLDNDASAPPVELQQGQQYEVPPPPLYTCQPSPGIYQPDYQPQKQPPGPYGQVQQQDIPPQYTHQPTGFLHPTYPPYQQQPVTNGQQREPSPQITHQSIGSVQSAYPPQQPQPETSRQALRVPPRQTNWHETTNHVPQNDYFWLAVFVTLCCCSPLGIVGLIKSGQVTDRIATGDLPGARRAARDARRYSMVGFYISVVLIGVAVIVFTVLALLTNDIH